MTLLLSLFAVIMMMTGCKQPSITGSWKAKNADVKEIFGKYVAAQDAELKSATFELDINDATLTEKSNMLLEGSSDGINVKVDVYLEIRYSYKREGDLVKMEYISHNFKINDVNFDAEIEAALAEAGTSKNEIKDAMMAEMKNDDSDIDKTSSFLIKSIEENRMTIEDESGLLELLRTK